jgi:GTP cyclohydrolase II
LRNAPQRCDCGAQLEGAVRAIGESGRGALLYLRQEGRGIGLLNKIRAYRLQDAGADTVEANHRLGFAADLRDYAIGAAVLGGLGVRSLRLMTNNPHKVQALEGLGVAVADRVPLLAGWNQHKRPGLGISSDKSERLTEFIPGRLDTLLVTVQRQAVRSLPTASGAHPIFRQSSD